MSSVLIISLLEAFLVIALVATVLYLKWREKHYRHADFEKLLDDIKDRQDTRGNKLSRRFVDKYHLDQASAQNLSERLLAAEKQFLQQFIEQQLQQHSVANFYENLCDLLDNYLNSPTQTISETKIKPEAQPEQRSQTHEQSTTEIEESEIADGNALISDDPPPTWGDVFDE